MAKFTIDDRFQRTPMHKKNPIVLSCCVTLLSFGVVEVEL